MDEKAIGAKIIIVRSDEFACPGPGEFGGFITKALNRHGSAFSKITILNVDDDDGGRYGVGRILRQAGFEVLEADSGWKMKAIAIR